MDQDHKHQCKFCMKIFPCGRSLGGHMRSHLSSSSDAGKGKLKGSGGYGLRENPKKNLRVFGSMASLNDRSEKLCRECGKEFHSWKALFGHMRCHSQKMNTRTVVKEEVEEDVDEGSLSNGSLIEGSIVLKVPRKKKRSRQAFSSSSSYSSSSSSIFEYSKEQEEVAISLMMLSRDVGHWGFGFNHVGGSSDKNSAILEDHEDLVFEGLVSLKSKKLNSDYVNDSDNYFELEEKKIELDANDSQLGRSKYECAACNKSFHTYQALGGHKASHKRMKDCFAPIARVVGNEDVGVIKSNHQCAICGKVFSSGQALGGHKRCHLVVASPRVVIQQGEESIDLNLLAPIECVPVDIDVDVYNTWWVGSNLENEEMVDMIEN